LATATGALEDATGGDLVDLDASAMGANGLAAVPTHRLEKAVRLVVGQAEDLRQREVAGGG